MDWLPPSLMVFLIFYIGECYHILSAAGQVDDEGADDDNDNDPVWMISLLAN